MSFDYRCENEHSSSAPQPLGKCPIPWCGAGVALVQRGPTEPADRGRCLACGKEFALTAKGLLRSHQAKKGLRRSCEGSGQPPAPQLTKEP